ncbi:unnamed protein product, partial [Bubo scandiacus]
MPWARIRCLLGSFSTSGQHACAVLASLLPKAACSHHTSPLSTMSFNRQSSTCVVASCLSRPE